MDYEKFIAEVQRRAGPISRAEAEVVTGAYLETLRERLSGDLPGRLAACLPGELAYCLEGEGGGEEYPVWEFHERLAQRAGIAPEHATRYARHVGSVLGDAVPEDELDAAREDLPPSIGNWRSVCSRTPTTTDRSYASPLSCDRPTRPWRTKCNLRGPLAPAELA